MGGVHQLFFQSCSPSTAAMARVRGSEEGWAADAWKSPAACPACMQTSAHPQLSRCPELATH